MRSAFRSPWWLVCLAALPGLESGCLLHAAKGAPPATGFVHIHGNHALSDDDIVSHLALTPSGRWMPWNREPHPFDPTVVPGDVKRIERIYQANGFYSASVTRVLLDRDDGRMNVDFYVREGPRTLVSSRSIEGLEALPPSVRAKVLSGLPLPPGSAIVEDRYEALEAELVRRLKRAGYIQAAVEGKVVVHPSTRRAEVSLTATPGRRLRISRVLVFGAVALSRDRIALVSGLHPGQLLTPQALGEAQRRIYALGVFTVVQVEPGAQERPGFAPVAITVHEAPFITVQAGGGLESDPYRSVAEVTGLWQNKNLARGLQRLTFSGGLGYALVPGVTSLFGGGLTAQGVVADGRLELVQPRILRSPVDVSSALDYTKDITSAFAYQRVGAHLGFPWHLDALLPTLTWTTSVNYDFYFGVSQEGVSPVGVANALETSGCGAATPGFPSSRCLLGYLEGQLSIDRRDNPVQTHRGWYLASDFQYAGLPGSEFSFVRLVPELRLYLPLWDGATLALRGRWGMLFQVGSSGRALPGVAKFFAGGANSVRAAGAQQIGPREFLVENNPDAGKPGVDPYIAGPPIPLGGDRLLEGSVELRLPTRWRNFGVVLFADGGAVDEVPERSTGLWPKRFWEADWGIGLRYATPVGPIRLDFANRLNGWSDVPVAVRTSAPAGFLAAHPLDMNQNDYRIATSCSAAGYPTAPGQKGYATRSHECYDEGGYLWGLQIFFSIGEAF